MGDTILLYFVEKDMKLFLNYIYAFYYNVLYTLRHGDTARENA